MKNFAIKKNTLVEVIVEWHGIKAIFVDFLRQKTG
jgi:hypothetical protein